MEKSEDVDDVNKLADQNLEITLREKARKRAEAKRERLLQQVRAGRDQLQTLSRQLMEGQAAERRHLARDLHDEIGQKRGRLG